MNLVPEESSVDLLNELYPGRVGTTLIRLGAREKRPLDSGWNVQAVENFTNQIDPGPILVSLAEHVDRGGNIGWAIPPGVLVLDADNAESAAWVAETFPDAPRQRTRNGCHVAVQEPVGIDLRQVTQLEIVDGITVDLRMSGRGQIAVEPSIHPSGFAYHWEIELPLDLGTLPEIPPALMERLRAKEEAQGPVDISAAQWREGSRETRLVSMAGRLRNMSLSEAEIRGTLGAINRERCAPQLPERDIAKIARSAGKWDVGDDPTTADDPAEVDTEVQAAGSLAFTGERLRELTSREPMPPIYPGIPAPGHLNLLVGAPFAGKTTSAIWGAMARAAGESPWLGAPAIPQGRTLFISPDESVEQMARQIKRLAFHHPAGRMFDYFEHIAVIGLDATVDPGRVDQLRFDEMGFKIIEELGAGFDSVVFDAYADMLPAGLSEDSNEDASAICGRLESMAVTLGIPFTLIHHIGKKPGGTAEFDPRDLGRGASALAAKARVISTFEEVPEFTRQRRIRTRTNLTKTPAPFDIEVASDQSDGEGIDFLRPMDPVASFPIIEILTDPDEWVSTSELARRLTGGSDGKPGGQALSLARRVRSIWHRAQLVELREYRNATQMRRKSRD